MDILPPRLTAEGLGTTAEPLSLATDGLLTSTVAVGAELGIRFNTRAAVGAELQAVWNVLESVSNDLEVPWQTRETAGAELEVLWDVASLEQVEPVPAAWLPPPPRFLIVARGRQVGLLGRQRGLGSVDLITLWNERVTLYDLDEDLMLV